MVRRLCVVLGLLLAACGGKSSPRVEFETPSYDFGTLDQLKEVVQTFKLRNAGTESVTIHAVKPDCGCASALLGQETLPAGGTSELQVTFHSLRLSGEVQKHVRLFGEDPKVPLATLTLRARVEPVFVLDPPIVRFGTVTEGTSTVQEVLLRHFRGKPFQILGMSAPAVKGPPLAATVSAEVVEKRQESCRLRITLQAKGPPGPITHRWVVQTDVDREVSVWYDAEIVAEVAVEPAQLYLGYVTRGVEEPHGFKVVHRGEGEIHLERVELEATSALEVARVHVLEKGRYYEVFLRISPRATLGRFSGQLRVHLSGRAEPLQVTYSGVVRE